MKMKISTMTYILFMFLVMLNYGFDNLNIPKGYGNTSIHDAIFVLSMFAALMCLISRKYAWKKFVVVVVFLSIGAVCYIKGGNTNLFILLFAVMLIDKTDIDTVLKLIFTERLIIFSVIVLGALVGVFANDKEIVEKGAYSVSAFTLGYEHPNSFASQAGFLMLLYLTIHRYSLNYWIIMLVFLLNLIIFIFAKSRISFVLTLLVLLGIWILKSKKFKRVWKTCAPIFYPCLMIFMFVTIGLKDILGFEHPIFVFINDGLFNGRVGLASMYLKTYSLSLFGESLDISIIARNTYYALDNGYIYILMYYGIVGFLMFAMIYQGTMMHLLKKEEYVLSFICAVSMIWGLYEGMMISLAGNFALLFWDAMLSNHKFDRKRC